MPTKLKAGLAFVSVASDNPQQTAAFFQAILGIDFVHALYNENAYHAPISEDGIDLNVNIRHSPQESAVPFFEVDDLDAAITAARNAGGNVVWGPQDVRMPDADFQEYKRAVKEVDNVDVNTPSMGNAAIVAAPGGSAIGLVKVADHAEKHFNAGKQRKPLSDYQDRVHARSKQAAQRRGH